MSKFKDIFKIGAEIGKPFLPGIAGSVLDIVKRNIDDDDDPHNTQSSKVMAKQIDELEHAIVILHERLAKLEK